MDLKDMGWAPFFENPVKSMDKHLVPARVICREKSSYRVLGTVMLNSFMAATS